MDIGVVWKAIESVIGLLVAKHGPPSKSDLEAIILALLRKELREQLDERDIAAALVRLGDALSAPVAPVVVPDLDIATDLGIYHEEQGWFAGRRNGLPVWSKDPDDADRWRTIGAAEHGLVLHGLRGAPGISIASIPTLKPRDNRAGVEELEEAPF